MHVSRFIMDIAEKHCRVSEISLNFVIERFKLHTTEFITSLRIMNEIKFYATGLVNF